MDKGEYEWHIVYRKGTERNRQPANNQKGIEENIRRIHMGQEVLVQEFRDKVIEGRCIDLAPIKEAYFPAVIEMRNQVRSRYFLNQPFLLDLEKQKEWYQRYLQRQNDLYWCILNKEGIAVGTIRLYDIVAGSCNQGSFIIHESYSMGMPYALEAEILTLEFAFEKLGMEYIINEDRHDNVIMNSMTKKMGFEFQQEIKIRRIAYNRYILRKEKCKAEKYKKLLCKFMDR